MECAATQMSRVVSQHRASDRSWRSDVVGRSPGDTPFDEQRVGGPETRAPYARGTALARSSDLHRNLPLHSAPM
ncbi:hypothetical protein VUR80DRAFT_4435 [Thermomyces stellatus]